MNLENFVYSYAMVSLYFSIKDIKLVYDCGYKTVLELHIVKTS